VAVVIGVMNGKGGVGKTTLSIVIAGQVAVQKRRAVILDCDDRQNAMRWWQMCAKSGRRPDHLDVRSAADPRETGRALAKADQEAEFVICDLEGRNTDLAGFVLSRADMIVCPAQPTAPDMAGVIQVKQFLDRFEELRGRPVPMVCVVNRMTLILEHTNAYKKRTELAEKLGFGLLGTVVWNRKPYVEMMDGLGTVQTMDPQQEPVAKAQREAAALVSEIVGSIMQHRRAAATAAVA